MCPSWNVLQRGTLDWYKATLAPRMVLVFHCSQVSPGLRAGLIMRLMCSSCALFAALRMLSVTGHDCPPPTARPPARVFGGA